MNELQSDCFLRANSTTVARSIRIAEIRVQFPVGPQSETVSHDQKRSHHLAINHLVCLGLIIIKNLLSMLHVHTYLI